jgi:hypothetical protein
MEALGLVELLGDSDGELEALTLAEGEAELEGDKLRDTDADGLTDADGEAELLGLRLLETELDGDNEAEADALGEADWLAEGDADSEALGLSERDTDWLTLADGDAELDGLAELEGDLDTEKLCIHISQFSEAVPVTFLYSNISPSTLPAGCGP